MKTKIFTLFFIFTFAFNLKAQIGLYNYADSTKIMNDTLIHYLPLNVYTGPKMLVKNEGSSIYTIKIRKTEKSIVSGTSNRFCLGVCYPEATFTSVDSFDVSQNTYCSEYFEPQYSPNNKAGCSTISYEIYDVYGSTSKTFTVVFCAAPTSINSLVPNFNVSNLYPNPANNSFSIDYSFEKSVKSAKFEITNTLGQIVKTTYLDSNNQAIEISTEGLNNGVYQISLILEGNKINTQKLVVSK